MVGWVVVGLLAAQGIRLAARWPLTLEAAAVAVILGLMVVIVVRLAAGTAPRGQHFSTGVFRLPTGVSPGALVLAATFGFLAFAGFESAASLGEEVQSPRRSIPRAMVSAIVADGVFYVACMLTQTLGFGVDRAGVAEFAGAAAPLDRLAAAYVGVPLAVELGVGLVLITISRLAGAAPLQMFFTLATFGVLNLLVMYVVTNLAALRVTDGPGAVLPVLGALVASYVLVRNIWPLPEPPLQSLPFLVLGWLALGGVLLLALPTRAARLTDALAREPAVG